MCAWVRSTSGVTEHLVAWNRGDRDGFARALPLVLDELRVICRRQMAREPTPHTLQPTALINELYLRWALRRPVRWRNRQHFLALAAAQIRRILVDHARRKRAVKRDGGVAPLEVTDRNAAAPQDRARAIDLLDLERALEELERMDPRFARLVELRYFVGLTAGEVATLMGITERTVLRHWAFVRAWLFRRLDLRSVVQ